jgi:hypothetical protein
MTGEPPGFEWDAEKSDANRIKHGVDFNEAVLAFGDPARLVFADTGHSAEESRFFCIGWSGRGIMTVRFTWRAERIRIFGAGYWRKGRRVYEQERGSLHRG